MVGGFWFKIFFWRLLEIKVFFGVYLFEDKRFLLSDILICRIVCE